MSKVGNFTKQTLKNGAKVIGGHRVKFVSEDKEFVILLTSYGYYYGIFLTYESDGAHVDEDRTPKQSKELCFNTLDECKKYWKVGEFADEEKVENPEPTPIMKQYEDLKSKHPDAILLFRCGDFYETYKEDAEKVSKVLGITLTVRNSDRVKMAGFPHHAIDTYLPKLIRAGLRVAICDQLEDPNLTNKLVKRGITEIVSKGEVEEQKPVAKEVKLEKADETVVELHIEKHAISQIEMRKIVTEACKANGLDTDHVSIWQHNGNGDYGIAVAFNGTKPVAVSSWERVRIDKKTTYTFVSEREGKFTELRKRI